MVGRNVVTLPAPPRGGALTLSSGPGRPLNHQLTTVQYWRYLVLQSVGLSGSHIRIISQTSVLLLPAPTKLGPSYCGMFIV